MIYDYRLYGDMKCSTEDQLSLIELVFRLLDYSKRAAREGLLALEVDTRKAGNTYLDRAIELITDGTDPEAVRNILYNSMCSSGLKGKELMEMAIILEGVISIQAGESRGVVEGRILSLLNEEARKIVSNKVKKDREDAFNSFKESFKNIKPLSENTSILDKAFKNIDDLFMKQLLSELDLNDINIALRGAGGIVYRLIFDNLSDKAGMLLMEDLALSPDYRDENRIIESQKRILDVIEKLSEIHGNNS